MRKDPNIQVSSNLMIDDEQHRPHYRFLPGDFVGEIYPALVDNRVWERELTPMQRMEFTQYIVCVRCRRTCAGTCSIGDTG
jgi:hypothetical protein